MTNVPRPVFLTFCQKNAWVDAPPDELPPMKSVHHLQFDHITVDTNTGGKNAGFVIVGMPGHPVEDLSFDTIRATFHGGGTEVDAANIVEELTPENLGNRWPEIGSLRKTIPARGLFARHVNGITLHDVEFKTTIPDARPAVVFQDVANGKADDSLREGETRPSTMTSPP